MSDFVQQNASKSAFTSADSWVILSPIEQSIKQKIESVGVPLKDWDIQINYGIKTGYNDAFIISTDKREEILANCADEDERRRTDELIRPILRGRDIKRYGYEWADLWLINTHNGVKGVKERIHIEDYPAIKAHLDQYWDKISVRSDKGDTPYNLRNCAYLDDFISPKIVWAELSRTGNSFVVDTQMHYVGNTGYILSIPDNNSQKLNYLSGILNSRCTLYQINQLTTRFDDNGWRWLRQFVECIRIPSFRIDEVISSIAESTNKTNQAVNSELINALVYNLYGLNKEERNYIDGLLSGY